MVITRSACSLNCLSFVASHGEELCEENVIRIAFLAHNRRSTLLLLKARRPERSVVARVPFALVVLRTSLCLLTSIPSLIEPEDPGMGHGERKEGHFHTDVFHYSSLPGLCIEVEVKRQKRESRTRPCGNAIGKMERGVLQACYATREMT